MQITRQDALQSLNKGMVISGMIATPHCTRDEAIEEFLCLEFENKVCLDYSFYEDRSATHKIVQKPLCQYFAHRFHMSHWTVKGLLHRKLIDMRDRMYPGGDIVQYHKWEQRMKAKREADKRKFQ